MCGFFVKELNAEVERHTVATRSLISEYEHSENAVVFYHTLCVKLLVEQVEGIAFFAHNLYAAVGLTQDMSEVSRRRRGGGGRERG